MVVRSDVYGVEFVLHLYKVNVEIDTFREFLFVAAQYDPHLSVGIKFVPWP